MNSIQKFIKSHPTLNKIQIKLERTIKDLNKRFSDKIYFIIVANLLLIVFQLIYLRMRYAFINLEVPLWYTKMWGDYQLADKSMLYLIPLLSFVIMTVGLAFAIPVRRYYIRYGISLIGIFTVGANSLLTGSLLRIMFKASTPFEPLINPLYLDLIVPGIIAMLAMHFVLPRFISYAQEKDIVTNPTLHKHPGMLLDEPSARGGGFIYGISFLVMAIVFVGLSPKLWPFYLALLIISILGILDDIQNTHPESKLRFLENPYVRLILLFLIVSIISVLGERIFYISSPFGGLFFFNSTLVSAVITTFWIVWVLNVLSWSNGIDGQYAGIVGVASILIVLLALRFDPLELEHKRVALMAAISAGLAFGFVKFTWHPSKILWGFGAVSAGLVLSVLSIMISSKILTSIIIILIPFLDAFVTVVRRIMQGKNPLRGDSGHLHHILLKRGWSVRRIALFYWGTAIIFGGLGYFSVDSFTLQTGLILVGIAAFFIVLLNVKLRKEIIAPEDSLNHSRK